MRLWQYPIKAEPVLPSDLRPETPQLDKWFREAATPQAAWKKRSAYSLAALVAGAVFVNVGSAPTAFAQDAPHIVFPHRIQYQAVARPITTFFPEAPQLDKWWVQASEPRRDRVRLQYTFPTFFAAIEEEPAEEVSPDSWYRPAEIPVRRADHRTRYPGFFFDPIPRSVAYELTPELWTNPLARVPRAPQNQHLYPSLANDSTGLAAGEAITLDKWFQPTSEARRDRDRRQHLYPSLLGSLEEEPAEEVSLDAWHPILSLPSRASSRRHEYPYFFSAIQQPAPAEVVTLDKWLASQPLVRQRPARAYLTPGLSLPTLVPLNPVFSQQATAVVFPHRTQYQRLAFVPVVVSAPPETITLDKWSPVLPHMRPADKVRRYLATVPQRDQKPVAAPATGLRTRTTMGFGL